MQTLVAFAETGTLARTAEVVGRTPSAVTAQMQRLEALAGISLLEAAGRRRVLTEAGERLVGHARRILAANREAWLSLAGTAADGRIGLGLTQDFAGGALPPLLNAFARTHPRVRLDLRVGRSLELSKDFAAGRITVLLAARSKVESDEAAVLQEPMRWLCAKDGLAGKPDGTLPLAVLDAPCSFREAALGALEAEAIPYRIASTGPSLAGLYAAVCAGIAVTVRTARSIDGNVVAAPRKLSLPRLPRAEFSLRVRRDAEEPAHRLAELLSSGLRLDATSPARGTGIHR
ncbi:LysR substrate-binding domain-containing protein [Pelagibius sp.]|uniref:LysR substrate-binding domain-containing protein n=1 Tax=Pelagibius sp. TaxID=1931238 RepID=UPI003BB20B53